MTKILALIAIAALSFNALADATIRSQDRTMTSIIHSAGMTYGVNEAADLQVEAYVSSRTGNSTTRFRYAVTGCDHEGGRIGIIADDDSIKGQKVWFYTGETVLDGIAVNICIEAAKKVKGTQPKTKI